MSVCVEVGGGGRGGRCRGTGLEGAAGKSCLRGGGGLLVFIIYASISL